MSSSLHGAGRILTSAFFKRDVLIVARELIGTELHWGETAGIIIETEAYAVHDDPACHTASRPSARLFIADHAPGTAYVYLNYGMHWLFNLLVKGGSRDGLVLIRALEPTKGLPLMQERRRQTKLEALCSGPGKLASALGILGHDHGTHLTGAKRPSHCKLVSRQRFDDESVVEDVRIGISSARGYPWRFLVKDHPHVSVASGSAK